ncbi:MAG: type II toxin-antitoxin system RelB/DinJ family antitoxin [Synergistaceae bacterium]|nr:type II toxin-antitoxin system RelB/DinJ family antitoxin [Synergistaceae bacterium]
MTTAVAEIEYIPVDAKLKREAESVLSQIGMSYAQAVDILARQIIFRRKFPENLEQPPIPCIEDMTEEELDMHIQRAFDEIEAGKYHTAEEVRKIMEAENDGF